MQLENILGMFYRASHIPVSLIRENSILLNIHGLQADHNIPLLISAGLPEDLPDVWYAHLSDHAVFGGMRYSAGAMLTSNGNAQLTANGAQPAEDGMLLLGPVPMHELSSGHVMEIMRQVGYRAQEFNDITQYFGRQTVCDEEMIASSLYLLALLLQEPICTDPIPRVVYQRPELLPLLPEDPEDNSDPVMERAILDSIRAGDPDRLRKVFQKYQLSTGRGNRPTITPIEHSYLIGSISLASRAAVGGGMDYSRSMMMCSHYLDRLLAARTIREQNSVFLNALMDYAQEVKNVKQSIPENAGELARNVAAYVLGHLSSANSPSEIAGALGYTTSYLCTAFHTQTGMTISEFVNRRKIDEAKRLLETSNASAGDIAVQLGFGSQSYFCTVFRQQAGMKPREHRKKLLEQ